MKTVLITGGAGFIGSYCCRKLLDTGNFNVVCVDNLSTGNISNIENYDLNDHFTFHNMEVSDPKIEEHVKDADFVLHFASAVGVEYIDDNISESILNSLKINMTILPLFDKHNSKVIYASTSEVYGNHMNEESIETDDCVIGNPDILRWSYACNKLQTEFLIKNYDFDHAILRLFNIVGPKQTGDYGMVLPKFIKMAKSNKDITVFGDGSQVRCFCHIEDLWYVIEKTLRMMGDPKHMWVNGTFNVGTTEEVSIKTLAETIIRITGSKSKIKYIPYHKKFSKNHADIMFRRPNIDKIKKVFRYEPMYNIGGIILSILHPDGK